MTQKRGGRPKRHSISRNVCKNVVASRLPSFLIPSTAHQQMCLCGSKDNSCKIMVRRLSRIWAALMTTRTRRRICRPGSKNQKSLRLSEKSSVTSCGHTWMRASSTLTSSASKKCASKTNRASKSTSSTSPTSSRLWLSG